MSEQHRPDAPPAPGEPASVRVRLDLAYDGGAFHGWARQPGLDSVQGALEDGLERILRRPVRTVVAGRTDAGVHARGQVVHLDLTETEWAGLTRGRPGLEPARGTEEHRQCRFWMHYAEGSLMNWLVMKLVFMTIPTQPMPFFVRPIARQLCAKVQAALIDPNVDTAMAFMDSHLATHTWFAGPVLTLADFQMSFAVEAALSRAGKADRYPHLAAFRQRMNARPAYQRAIAQGGPVVM